MRCVLKQQNRRLGKALLFALLLSSVSVGCTNKQRNKQNENNEITKLQEKINTGYFDNPPIYPRDYSAATITLTFEESAKFHRYTVDDFDDVRIIWICEDYHYIKENGEQYPKLNERRVLNVGFAGYTFESFKDNVMSLSKCSFIYDIDYQSPGESN